MNSMKVLLSALVLTGMVGGTALAAAGTASVSGAGTESHAITPVKHKTVKHRIVKHKKTKKTSSATTQPAPALGAH